MEEQMWRVKKLCLVLQVGIRELRVIKGQLVCNQIVDTYVENTYVFIARTLHRHPMFSLPFGQIYYLGFNLLSGKFARKTRAVFTTTFKGLGYERVAEQ